MYDRFIERLSKSKYKDNFILKGGFYLSKLFGIDKRSTIDIDTSARKIDFNKDNIFKIVKEIITIDLKDNVKFKIEKDEPIRIDDEYGGLRLTITFNLENIKDKFHIDIATGDPIYPGPYIFQYKSLINNDIFPIWAYSIETVIAEKLETIFSKLEKTSRMKDYYDIYLIYKLKFDDMNKTQIKKAIHKTFNKRNFQSELKKDLIIIKNSNDLKTKWISYTKKNSYAKDIDFSEIIKCLEDFIKII